MKRTMTLLCVGLAAGFVSAQSWLATNKVPSKAKGFIDDFDQAKKEATAFKQPIFALFTGSDWCPWCIKLHDEILDAPSFKSFAETNLVLFEADFPRGKSLPKKVQKQNEELSAKYRVSGFPTVLLLDAEGAVRGTTGYQQGGADAFVKNLKDMLERTGFKVSASAAQTAKPLSLYERMKAEKAAKKP